MPKTVDAVPMQPGQAIEREIVDVLGTARRHFLHIVRKTGTKAEDGLGLFFNERLANFHAGRLTIEGLPETTAGAANLWVCAHPLDAGIDFRKRGGTAGLPFTGVITVFDKVEGAKFKDIIAAAVIDYRTDEDLWSAWRDEHGDYHTTFHHSRQPPVPEQAKEINLRDMVVFADWYRQDTRDLACEMFRDEVGWLRDSGSAAYEMACVASGTAAGAFCLQWRHRDLSAGFAIVEGVKGAVRGLDGRSIHEMPFNFHGSMPAICAGNAAIAAEIVARAKKACRALERRAAAENYLRHMELQHAKIANDV